MKCRPWKNLTSGLGAVKLTRAVGMNELPNPDLGGPSSMFHDEGASTDVTGILVSCRASITPGKGSRTSPEKLKPELTINDEILLEHGKEKMTIRTENGVHDMIGRPQSGGKVICKRHFEVLQLFCQPLCTRSALFERRKPDQNVPSHATRPHRFIEEHSVPGIQSERGAMRTLQVHT